jgi:mono/diheme cytochrome c family protein
MKNAVVLAAALLAVSTSAGAQTPADRKAERVERGRYLVNIAGCHDCHSPKADTMMTPDPKRLLSGRPLNTAPPMQGTNEIRASLDFTAFAGPWGNSYAANLTPDRETGIGARYTEAAFIRTIRSGKKPEGEALAPPMPWPVYSKMTDEDLKAVYAYLRTLTPVRNFVRGAAPAVVTQH